MQLKKSAFTLAETLITLAIIGVVAALTIPTIIRNYQEKQTVTKVKKFYSDISKAYNMAKIEKGNIENFNATTSKQLFNYFKPYLATIKECEGKNTSCGYNGTYKTLNPKVNWANINLNSVPNSHRVILQDGTTVLFGHTSPNCTTNNTETNKENKFLQNSCGYLYIDINGLKAPNALGLDTFGFYITKYGIYFFGAPHWSLEISQKCNKLSTDAYNGTGCTAWIITKGNMDYLRHNISW